jgi:hypothetical protein
MAYREQDIDLENLDQLVEQFLENGGSITVCEKYARSEDIEYTVGWGKKRKKQVDPSTK